MNKKLLTAAVSSAALLFASGAWADEESGDHWYTTIFAGAAFGDDLAVDYLIDFGEGVEQGSIDIPLETGYLLGWTLGYDNLFSAGGFGLRPEVELSFRQQDVDLQEIEESEFPDGVTLPVDLLTLFANLWIDFKLNGVTPYVGGGIGVGWADLPSGDFAHIESVDMVWQFGGGLNFDLCESVFVGVGYRYVGADFEENVILFGPTSNLEYEYRTHEVFGNLGVRF